jgi:hypothetical protein
MLNLFCGELYYPSQFSRTGVVGLSAGYCWSLREEQITYLSAIICGSMINIAVALETGG